MERFIVSIEKDTDGTYVAYNTEASDYVISGRGDTVEEAEKAFMDTVQETAEYEREKSGKVSPILTESPEFKYDVSSQFDYYKV